MSFVFDRFAPVSFFGGGGYVFVLYLKLVLKVTVLLFSKTVTRTQHVTVNTEFLTSVVWLVLCGMQGKFIWTLCCGIRMHVF
jgi:hypothetical protein